MSEIIKTATIVISLVVASVPAAYFLISIYMSKQKELEDEKVKQTSSALNRLNDDVKDFRIAIDSLQNTAKELSAALVQSRADMGVLKERIDDTKKLLELYSQSNDEKIRNTIKTEITELTKQLMLIRTKKAGT